jgi:membrane associated rhomboid family serine protease
MAFRSNGPVMLALPPFRGVTRRIILTALIAYFGLAVIGLLSAEMSIRLHNLAGLIPDIALHGAVWMFLSYPFVTDGLLNLLFALLSVWFFASSLEDERGGRWLMEYFLLTTIGGGLLASLLAMALGPANRWIPYAQTMGLWPFVMAAVVAFAYSHPEQEVRFQFILTLKAKYLAAIYVLFYLAISLTGGDRFGSAVTLLAALCGYVFLRFAPRRGVRMAVSEWWFGLRNAYYRQKRRRAAKKFTVYMRKQGKDVSLDKDGRYIDPNGTPRDLNDKNWMN